MRKKVTIEAYWDEGEQPDVVLHLVTMGYYDVDVTEEEVP